jgi:hypothetical protein
LTYDHADGGRLDNEDSRQYRMGESPHDGKGDQTVSNTTTCHVVHEEQVGDLHLSRDNLERLLGSGSFFWIDLSQPTEEDFALLRDVFQFHPLALEDFRTLRSAGEARRLRRLRLSRRPRRRPRRRPAGRGTDFFGQNFGWLVRYIAGWPAFVLGIGTQIVTVVILMTFFRRRGWF